VFIKWREENKPSPPEQEAELARLRPAWANHQRDPKAHRLYAYLAKSVRVEGKPRQKIIVYLGSLPAICAQDCTSDEWRAFWFKVYCALALKHAAWQVNRDVLGEIGQRVQSPSDEDLRRIVAEEWACYPQWKKDYPGIRRALEWTNEAWSW
jgi:hypothetical protein